LTTVLPAEPLFLQAFVEKIPFIHCDIAGMAIETKNKCGMGAM
ncbi:41331_t:CDS:1, partial [Gigaspora margarita]